MGSLRLGEQRVVEPHLAVLDPKNKDAVEAGYYDLQIRRLAKGLSLKSNYGALRLALHLPVNEMKKGLRNYLARKRK